MSLLHTDKDPRHAVPSPMREGPYRLLPLAAVIGSFAVVAFYYGSLPDTIPIHFNARGVADGFGPKFMLWILPALNLGLFYLLEMTTKSSFRWFNYPVKITEENAAEQHRIALQLVAVVRAITCLMIGWLVFEIVHTVRNGGGNLNAWVMGAFLLALFGSIIYYTVEANKAK